MYVQTKNKHSCCCTIYPCAHCTVLKLRGGLKKIGEGGGIFNIVGLFRHYCLCTGRPQYHRRMVSITTDLLITQGPSFPQCEHIFLWSSAVLCVYAHIQCKQYAGLAHTGYMILSETWPPPTANINHTGTTHNICPTLCWRNNFLKTFRNVLNLHIYVHCTH